MDDNSTAVAMRKRGPKRVDGRGLLPTLSELTAVVWYP